MSYIGQKPAERILTSADISDAAITAAKLASSSVTQPKINGGVAGTGPAFSAYSNALQSITSSTFTKIQFQLEEFDTASCFNNTSGTVGGIPAYAFLPNVAGYYQVQVSMGPNTATTATQAGIYKNGSLHKRNIGNSSNQACEVTSLVYLNGTTDYIEGYGLLVGTSPAIQNAIDYTYFQASMVRAA